MFKDFKNQKELYVIKEKYTNIFDITEKPKYGLVDHLGNEIVVKKSKLDLSTRYNVILLQDIIQPFEEMMDYFKNLNNKGLIDSSNTFLNSLQVISGYTDNTAERTTQLQSSLLQTKAYVKQKNLTIKNFEDFFNAWAGARAAGGGRGVNTLSVLARGADLVGSGLAAQLSAGGGRLRREKVFSDKYFDIYADTAKYFGFLVNFYNPLQLIFNISSEVMSISLDKFFAERYTRFIETELDEVFYYLTTLYNLLYEENKYVIEKRYKKCSTENIISLKEKTPTKRDIDLIKLYLDYMLTCSTRKIDDSEYKKVLNICYALPELEAVEYIKNVTGVK